MKKRLSSSRKDKLGRTHQNKFQDCKIVIADLSETGIIGISRRKGEFSICQHETNELE